MIKNYFSDENSKKVEKQSPKRKTKETPKPIHPYERPSLPKEIKSNSVSTDESIFNLDTKKITMKESSPNVSEEK